MKTLFISTALAAFLALPTAALAQANLKKHPAYLNIDGALDLKTIKPEVNINVPRFLLNSALAEFDGGKDDPIGRLGINLKELTQDIQLLRVVVLDADDEHQEAVRKGLKKLHAQLEEHWTAIVSLPEDNVHVYARSDESGEELAGLALLVAEDGEAVIGNLVGNVPIGRIAKIAAHLGEDMVPRELLQTLATLHGAHGGEVEGGHGQGHAAEAEAAHGEDHSNAEDTHAEASADDTARGR